MESIGPVLEIVRLAVVLGLLVVLPGVAIGPYVAPGATSPLARVGRAIGVGLLATSVACAALAVVGLLRPTILATVLAGLSILPLHAERPSWRGLSSRARRWWFSAAVTVAVAVAFAFGPSIVRTPADGLPLAPATWEGVPAALVLAESGGLPVRIPAWNGSLALGVAELPAVAHLAGAIQLLPGDLAARLLVYRVTLILAALVVTALVLRRWVSTWPALLGAGLFVGLLGGARPLVAEPVVALPLVLALTALWLADRAIVERSRRLLGSTALVTGFVLLQRVDLFVVAVAGIAAIALARWVVSPGGGPESAGGLGHRHGRRLGLRQDLGRATLAPIVAAGLLLAGSAAVGGAGSGVLALIVPSGAVLGAVDPDLAGPALGAAAPGGWRSSDDASWDFLVATSPDAEPGSRSLGAPAFATALGAAIGAAGGLPGAVIPAGVVLMALGTWPLLDARRQRLVAAVGAFALILGATSALVLAAEGPFGLRRIALEGLVPLEWLVPAAAASLVGWQLARALEHRGLRAGVDLRAGPWPHVVLGAVPLLLIVAVLLGGGDATGRIGVGTRGLTAAGAAAWAYVAAETPPGARILTNARTDGVAAALGTRTGVLDGPDADPRNADAVARATALVLGARVALASPTGEVAAAWLGREGVTHLLVAGPHATPADLGGGAIFETDLAALLASPAFELVETFEHRVYLFELRFGH